VGGEDLAGRDEEQIVADPEEAGGRELPAPGEFVGQGGDPFHDPGGDVRNFRGAWFQTTTHRQPEVPAKDQGMGDLEVRQRILVEIIVHILLVGVLDEGIGVVPDRVIVHVAFQGAGGLEEGLLDTGDVIPEILLLHPVEAVLDQGVDAQAQQEHQRHQPGGSDQQGLVAQGKVVEPFPGEGGGIRGGRLRAHDRFRQATPALSLTEERAPFLLHRPISRNPESENGILGVTVPVFTPLALCLLDECR